MPPQPRKGVESALTRMNSGPTADSGRKSPKVSVITAVYNAGAYIEATVRSILGQSFGDFEYILVDDGSKDNSVDVIQQFSDPRIYLLLNDTNRGVIYSRNHAISVCNGQYIALTDADDVSLPERLAEQVKFLDAHPEIALVGTWQHFIGGNGRRLSTKRRERHYSPEQCRAALLFRNFFGNSTLMFRREAIPNPAYSPTIPFSEDYNFILRISERNKVALLPRAMVLYRVHDGNYSRQFQGPYYDWARNLKGNLLRRLGLEATEQQLDLHLDLEAEAITPTPASLEETHGWLETVLTANERCRIYDSGALKMVAANEWFESCQRASSLGYGTWRRFRNSALASCSQYGWAAQSKLFLRCVGI